jgi:hypothetical protein
VRSAGYIEERRESATRRRIAALLKASWRHLLLRKLDHYKTCAEVDHYKTCVTSISPQLPIETVHLWTISKDDALAMSYFLRRLKGEGLTTILDIGTFVGVSAFFFASQPKVRRVVSVDPDPLISEEVVASYRNHAATYHDKRVLEVAREALSVFPAQSNKVELKTGVVGMNEMALIGKDVSEVKRVSVPREPLVAFVDGRHSPVGVYQDLLAIFQQNPQALVLVHDCRGPHAPFVRSGVASLLKEATLKESTYHFRLFEPLPLELGTPSLGVVYPQERATEVGQILRELSSPTRLTLSR